MSRVRAAKWEFFLNRWSAIYDWASGTVKAAQDGTAAGAARMSAEEVRAPVRCMRARCPCEHSMPSLSRHLRTWPWKMYAHA
jgi:hypothetical protein